MADIDQKRAELRALMRLTQGSETGAGLVLNALLEATLKQQEGSPLGNVEVGEQALLDFLELLTAQTTIAQRAAARDTSGERPAEPLFQAFEEIVRMTYDFWWARRSVRKYDAAWHQGAMTNA